MEKKRILYFDAIKFVAIIFVFVCHFARTLERYHISYGFKILPDALFSIYTGTAGSVLFFIVSGAALMHVYQDQINLKSYFMKRVKGIYLMFWISFIIFFCIQFYTGGGYDKNIPLLRSIYTLVGMDGLAENFCATFYTVGEWFLGIIIILYILFPALKKFVDEFPNATLAVSFLTGIIVDYTYSAGHVDITKIFVVWIPVFVLGMVFSKNMKTVNNCMVLASMVLLTVFTVFDLEFINTMTRIYIVGMALFFLLVYLFNNIENRVFRIVSSFVSRYTYPIFLVHHRVMIIFIKKFSNHVLSAGEVVWLFIFVILMTMVSSYLVERITNAVLVLWRENDA